MIGARARHLLLTGPPGVGKTTIVRRLADHLASLRLAGFYTEEIREAGAGSFMSPVPAREL